MSNNSTDETDRNNFFTVSCLLINEGTKALTLEFDRKIQHRHGNLEDALTYAPISQFMTDVYRGKNGKPKLLNESQYKKLYPKKNHPADSKTFDITLLAFLFRNLLRLESPVTNTWPSSPGPNDVSLAADISRLTIIRNALGHITEAKLDTIQFEGFWHKLEAILTRLNVSQSEIDHWKRFPFSEEQLVQNQNALKAQILDDFEHLAERVVKKIVNREHAVLTDSAKVIPEKMKITKDWPSEATWSLGKKYFQIDEKEVQYLLLKDTESCECQLFSSNNDQLQLLSFQSKKVHDIEYVRPSRIDAYYPLHLLSLTPVQPLSLSKLAPREDLDDHILETAPKEVFSIIHDDPANINSFPCHYDMTGYKVHNLKMFLQKLHQSDDWITAKGLVQMKSIELMENVNDGKKSNGIVGCNLPSDRTLNEWSFIYCDTRIVSLKKLDKQRIAKMVTEMSHSKLAVNIQSSNILAVLHGLPQVTVDGFVSKLRNWCIISSDEKRAIVSKLDNLINIMEDKSLSNLEDFVLLLKLREETFATGCQLQYTIELGNILTQSQKGAIGSVQNERPLSLLARFKNALVKISSQGLNKSMIEHNMDNFKARVLRVEEVSSVSEGSININIKIQDEWEFANLKRDIECGIFVDRYCLWLQENGETIPEGEEIEVTLTYSGTVELIYKGIATLKKKNSETEDSTSWTPQIKELTELDRRRIKRKLEEQDGTSVHYVAINMVSQNIIRVLYELQNHILTFILKNLKGKEVITSTEMEDLKNHQMDKVRCLEELVDLIALKDCNKINTFMRVVRCYSVQLSEHINSVWEYSMQINSGPVAPAVICDDFSVLTQGRYVVEKNVPVGGICAKRLCVVGDQLWVITTNTLKKYTSNCDLVATINTNKLNQLSKFSAKTGSDGSSFVSNEGVKEISDANAALQTERGDILVADLKNGIHFLHVESNNIKTISQEGCADLAEYQGLVYGLIPGHNKVVVVGSNSLKSSWNVLKDIYLSKYYESPSDRICIHNDAIYISSWHNNCIYVYNMTDSLHGNNGYDSPGLLYHPRLCSIDSKGTALLANEQNRHLQLCTSTGDLSTVTLPEVVECPVDAGVNNTAGHCLWVLGVHRLYKLVRK